MKTHPERLAETLEHCRKLDAQRKPKRVRTDAVIYFVLAGQYVKVGVTTRKLLKLRISAIQVGNPYPVRLLKALHTDNAFDDERAFHHALRQFHIRGEWFLITSPAIMELLGA